MYYIGLSPQPHKPDGQAHWLCLQTLTEGDGRQAHRGALGPSMMHSQPTCRGKDGFPVAWQIPAFLSQEQPLPGMMNPWEKPQPTKRGCSCSMAPGTAEHNIYPSINSSGRCTVPALMLPSV